LAGLPPILIEVFPGSQSLQANAGIRSVILTPQPLLSKFLPIHKSAIALPFDFITGTGSIMNLPTKKKKKSSD
jgi:hypothetical protein